MQRFRSSPAHAIWPKELHKNQGEDIDQDDEQRHRADHGTGGHPHALEEDPGYKDGGLQISNRMRP